MVVVSLSDSDQEDFSERQSHRLRHIDVTVVEKNLIRRKCPRVMMDCLETWRRAVPH